MDKKLKFGFIIIAMVWLTIAIYYFTQVNNSLEVIILDVGQGDSILIKTPDGQVILIDGGPDRVVLDRLANYLPWWQREIDLIILTHPHADHVTGFNYILEQYQVNLAIITDAEHDSGNYSSFLDSLVEHQVDLQIMTAPLVVDMTSCQLKLLYPNQPMVGVSNLNNTSIVSQLSCGSLDWLFTGDIEETAEETLLSLGYNLQSEFLKVAHHGSDSSTSLEFLQAVQPELAIITVGEDNRYDFPDEEVINRLESANISIWQTGQQGSLRIISSDLEAWQIK